MSCEGEHCITCGDVAVPLTVVLVDEERGLALCENGEGARETVELGIVDGAAPGEALLVHAGVALTRLEAVT